MLRWAGHISRMTDERIPKQLLYGQLADSSRSLGRPRQRYKVDVLMAKLKSCNININMWEAEATDRPSCRTKCAAAVKRREEHRQAISHQKRVNQWQRAAEGVMQGGGAGFRCEHCGKVYRARIGLISHMKTHNRSWHRRAPDVSPYIKIFGVFSYFDLKD